MNEKVFVDKFIQAYLTSISPENRNTLGDVVKCHFNTLYAVSAFLNDSDTVLVNKVRDTFYSSLTDEEKLEWALIN